MGRTSRITIYVILAAVFVVLGLSCLYSYLRGLDFLDHAVATKCLTLNYTIGNRPCEQVYGGGCLQVILGVGYDNYSSFLHVWDGVIGEDARSWAEAHYPVGGNFSCVYSSTDPLAVQLEIPATFAWFIFALVAFSAVTAGAGACLVGEVHHARPQGLCGQKYVPVG